MSGSYAWNLYNSPGVVDGRNLSSLMMKEEIKEKRPVSSKWMLLTVLGIVFIILAIKQYKPGTWGYYFAHIYFLIGGILIITFSGDIYS